MRRSAAWSTPSGCRRRCCPARLSGEESRPIAALATESPLACSCRLTGSGRASRQRFRRAARQLKVQQPSPASPAAEEEEEEEEEETPMITVLDPVITAAFSELSPGKALHRARTPDRTSSRVGADRAGRDVEPGCDHVNPALCGHANQPSSQVHGTSGDPSEDLFPRGPLGKRSSEGSPEVPWAAPDTGRAWPETLGFAAATPSMPRPSTTPCTAAGGGPAVCAHVCGLSTTRFANQHASLLTEPC